MSPSDAAPRSVLDHLTSPRDVRPAALVVLGLAAVAVAVGGWEHAYLYHRGYEDIATIGPLFLINAVASLCTVLVLLARRPGPFVLLSLAISVGSLIAIVLTRTTGLFGFEESGYDSRAVLTIVAEVVAVVLTVVGAVLARGDLREGPVSANAIRWVLASVVTVVLGAAILGVGLGEDDGGGGGTATRATGGDDAVRVLGAEGARGKAVFRGEGCAGCHTLSDAASTGRIGPNLDDAIADDDAEEIRRDVVDPGPGMPDRYGDLPKADLDALVRYLEAATRER